MKRFLCLVLSLSILISLCPVIAFAEELGLGTENNPIVINAEKPYVFYEAESYPVGTNENYKIVDDTNASGNQAVSKDVAITYSELSTTGDNAHYRLWIKSANEGKIKIFLRMKTTSGKKGVITCAKNNDPVMDRSFYFEKSGEYYWFCPDSYEVKKNETFAFSMIFSLDNLYVDKIFITSDLMTFPEGTDGVSEEIDFSYMAGFYGEPSHTPIATHPRLFINSESIKSVKANLNEGENISAYNSLIARADAIPTSNAFQNAKGYILSNAFLSVISDDAIEKETRANNAINTLLESLKLKSNLQTDRSDKENLNEVIYRIFFISLVYDWCYDYLDDNKDTLISNILFYMAQQEYTYPPLNVSGVNNGHESEGDFFAGLLPAAIAIYDEYPDMYRLVGSKVLLEHVPTRNYYYKMNTHAQGSHYMRMTYEFYLRAILDNAVKKGLVNDGADSILMEYVFGLRPDNQIMRNGDHNAAGSRDGIKLSSTSLFYNSNYHNNPYLKDLYYRINPTPSFGYALTSICEPLWLIFNNPDLETRNFTELPLTYYAGDNAGVMYARTSWEMGNGEHSNQMAVRMNLETIFGEGHDHLDAGHFDIYYKGSLALDSGHYNGFGSIHHRNYYQRTIAHNSMLLYDPSEDMIHRGIECANDGGQSYKSSSGGIADTLFERQKTGEILAVDYGEDMYNPSFTYMKGDLTDAYSPQKMENYTRSFVFLNFFDEVYPGALIVFDKMTSKDASFKKTWLLHTQEEPEINGNTVIAGKSEEGDNGRLINTTLLPKSDDASIEKVGGTDLRYSVNGTNFDADMSNHAKDYGEWRVELSPKTSKVTDTFLNVLHVTENDESIEPLTPELIETADGNFKGVKIKNRIVLFNTSDTLAEGVMFTFQGSGEYEILVTGVSSGKWNIQSSNASSYDTSAIATENGSDLYFKGTAGTYRLRKDTYSSDSLTRNLDYKNYINKSSEEYSYIRLNNIYHSAPFFEQDGKLFVGAEYISEYLDSPLEYTADGLKYFNDIYSVEVLKDSEDVILKDGIYYVSPDALSDICFVEWTKENDYIYNLTICKRDIIKITTGQEFFDCSFTNEKALYIIEGKDELYDKTIGIKLPVDYETKSNFAGVIKGIEDKNNIEITGTKPLFYNCKSYYAKISNLTLKGTQTLVPENKEFGVLIGISRSTKDLVLENITNYLNVELPNSSSRCFVGGIIGYRNLGHTYIENCINHGHINALNNTNSGTFVGGIIGSVRSWADYNVDIDIKNSYNYGNISNNVGPAGGIYGASYAADVYVTVKSCGNYGDVLSTSYYGGTGGIIGTGYTVNVSETFNLGNINGGRMTGGIAGISRGISKIENSFNAGDVLSSTLDSVYYNCGIAFNYPSNTLVVKNCYNVGLAGGQYGREISNTTSGNRTGCYYTIDNTKNNHISGTLIEKEELATNLPVEFSPLVWEYTAVTDENKFSYPQLKGNNAVTTDDKFYSPKIPVTVGGGYEIFKGEPDEEVRDTFTGELITTPYVIVPAKFTFLSGVDIDGVEYGIFISKTVSGTSLNEKTCDKIAKGIKNVLGNFGILIYGKMLIPGDTYYVRPYVKYNDKYYYGLGNSFVFGE